MTARWARRRVCGETAACAALWILRDDCKSCRVEPECCVFASVAVRLPGSLVIVWERPWRRCVGTGGSLRHDGPLRCMSTSGIRCVTLCASVAQQRFLQAACRHARTPARAPTSARLFCDGCRITRCFHCAVVVFFALSAADCSTFGDRAEVSVVMSPTLCTHLAASRLIFLSCERHGGPTSHALESQVGKARKPSYQTDDVCTLRHLNMGCHGCRERKNQGGED